MARAHPIRIELTEDMSEIVESVLESGEFQSADEVVSAALNAFQVQRLLANFTPEELDTLIQEGSIAASRWMGRNPFVGCVNSSSVSSGRKLDELSSSATS